MVAYKEIFEKLKDLSSVDYSIRTFSEFQRQPSVRLGMKKIIDNVDFF